MICGENGISLVPIVYSSDDEYDDSDNLSPKIINPLGFAIYEHKVTKKDTELNHLIQYQKLAIVVSNIVLKEINNIDKNDANEPHITSILDEMCSEYDCDNDDEYCVRL